MDNVIFFCQASGDIVHILQEAHKIHTEDCNTSIKVLCLYKELIESWKFLSINFVKVEYLHKYDIPILYPWKIYNWRKKVNTLLKEKVFNHSISVKRVYFTSIYDDPISTYYIYKLYKMGYNIYYLNHYDDKQAIVPLVHTSLKDRIRLLMYKICTGIDFKLYHMSGRWNVIRFPKEEYNLKELTSEIDNSICQQYAYKVKNKTDKLVLFFSQPNRDLTLVENSEYDSINLQVINRLKEIGYYVVQKGHPVIGLCKQIQPLADLIIPSTIPSELIDIKAFKACYGFMTIALASTAKQGVPSFSFLPLLRNHNTESYEGAIKFIDSTSNNMIKYINDLKEIQ